MVLRTVGFLFLAFVTLGFIPPPTLHGSDTSNTFNLITDFHASCNGVADDGPAFNAAAGAQFRAIQAVHPFVPVTLVIPPGATCLLKTCPTASDGKTVFGDVANLTIIATGATITAINSGNCGIYTGSIVNPWTADHFNPNTIGDTCVTMTTPGTEANYPVGRWVVLSGEGVQVNSFPPNWVTFEYQQVVSNTGGRLCFNSPTQYFYPNDARAGIDLTGQNCSNNYCGGPGAVSLMAASWGGYVHTVGGTWDFHAAGGSVHWSSKLVVFDNMTWLSDPVNNQPNGCWYPTLLGTWIVNNTIFNRCAVEVDKEIDQIIINHSTQVGNGGLQFQSPSVHSIAVNNGSTMNLIGTPTLTTCNNSTLAGVAFGTTFGTPPDTFVGVNCTFSVGQQAVNSFDVDGVTLSYVGGGAFQRTLDICGGIPQGPSVGGTMLMDNVTGTNDADNYLTFTGISVPIIPATGVNCTQTMTINTTLTGPSLPPPGGHLVWFADQARNMSCSGCIPLNPNPSTGDRLANDLNFSAAQGKPLYTYFNRTYTCANNIANVPGSFDIVTGDGNWALRGNWVTFSVNVITPDTNPSDAGPQIGFAAGQIFNPTTGATSFDAQANNLFNLKIAGTRTRTPTTTTGAQSGDSFSTPAFGANTWVGGAGGQVQTGGVTNGPAAQCPVVQLIAQTTR